MGKSPKLGWKICAGAPQGGWARALLHAECEGQHVDQILEGFHVPKVPLQPVAADTTLSKACVKLLGERKQGKSQSEKLVASRGRVAIPPPPRTKWTRRVPHPVLIGHAASLSQVQGEQLRELPTQQHATENCRRARVLGHSERVA